MMGFGMLFMGLFWVGLIAGAVWLVSALLRLGQSPKGSGPNDPSPRDIMDERYAHGEITREQYDQMKKDLLE